MFHARHPAPNAFQRYFIPTCGHRLSGRGNNSTALRQYVQARSVSTNPRRKSYQPEKQVNKQN